MKQLSLLILLTLTILAGCETITVEEKTIIQNNTVIHNHTTIIREFEWSVHTPSKECKDVNPDELTVIEAQGISMQPYLFGWYKPLIKNPSGVGYVEGDYVLYETSGGLNIHRVDGVYHDKIIVCPTNDPTMDEGMTLCDVISPSQITGVMCGALYG